jgi:tetratricopeptide (TPR) repeat protein
LAIDSNNFNALHLLGHYRWIQELDWDAGEEVFRSSVELVPGAHGVHVVYADFLMAQGRIEEGLEEGRIAYTLDPLSSHTLASQARWAVLSRRYDEADPLTETFLTRDPDNVAALGMLAGAFLFGGQPERVPQLFQGQFSDPASLTPTHRAFFAMYLGAVGQADSARIEMDRAVSSAEGQYLDPTIVWSAYAALGEKEEAFDWIERGIESRSIGTVLLGVAPSADPLRDDPRYQAILDRIGIGHLKPRFDSLAAAAGEAPD